MFAKKSLMCTGKSRVYTRKSSMGRCCVAGKMSLTAHRGLSTLMRAREIHAHTLFLSFSQSRVHTHTHTHKHTHTFPVLQYETRYMYKGRMQPQIAYIVYAHVVCCRALQQGSATHNSIYSIRSCCVLQSPATGLCNTQ